MKHILNFCKGTKEYGIRTPKYVKRHLSKDEFVKLYIKNEHEALCSIDREEFIIFQFDIDYHNLEPNEALNSCLKDVKNINSSFDQKFLWRFSGRGIHGLAVIIKTKDNLEAIKKRGFKGYFDYYKSLIRRIAQVCKGADFKVTYHNKNGVMKPIGSLNLKSGKYCIPIDLRWSPKTILYKSEKREIKEYELPVLNVYYWLDLVKPEPKKIYPETKVTIDMEWHKKDHLLKFILGNKIPKNTNRNITLLKNIAINCVNSGMSKEEIKDIGKKIIKNMPGKVLSEFEGWIGWAKKRTGVVFNKREMNKWIKFSKLNIGYYKDE